MVAVAGGSTPLRRVPPPERARRYVALAASAMELLRPESDLARMVAGVGHVDLLLATEDEPVAEPSPLGVLGGAPVPDLDEDDVEDGSGSAADIAALGLPGLHVHRLGLERPLGAAAEPDLVAALSELVGFDPEPGVYCLGPGGAPTDPSHAVLDLSVQRIARVYGLPLRRYRGLELVRVR